METTVELASIEVERVVEYKVLQSSIIENLEAMVLVQIDEGWQPLGGVSTCVIYQDGEGHAVFAQAMVVYGAEKDS